MANACVSHEMRNPLNAISSLNHVKKKLYMRINNFLEENPNDALKKVMVELF